MLQCIPKSKVRSQKVDKAKKEEENEIQEANRIQLFHIKARDTNNVIENTIKNEKSKNKDKIKIVKDCKLNNKDESRLSRTTGRS